jgi:hypothetical protein
MIRLSLVVVCVCTFLSASAIDEAAALIRILNKRFALVNDYKANVLMEFQIPGVKMNAMNGQVLFKKPNKFRIRTKGIFFLPKQNPMEQMSAMLLDTTSYTSVISGYEAVSGKQCAVVNIIPLQSGTELILGKFWIDSKNPQVLKSQITTKNSGTIETENVYGSFAAYNLPDKITINLETKKIKMSKLMSADLNKKSAPKTDANKLEKGTITMHFSNYKVNSKLADAEFAELPR